MSQGAGLGNLLIFALPVLLISSCSRRSGVGSGG